MEPLAFKLNVLISVYFMTLPWLFSGFFSVHIVSSVSDNKTNMVL